MALYSKKASELKMTEPSVLPGVESTLPDTSAAFKMSLKAGVHKMFGNAGKMEKQGRKKASKVHK